MQRYNIIFFAHENIKKHPQKLLIIDPIFFSSTGPAAQTSPELIFHVINMSQDSSVSLSVMYYVEHKQKQRLSKLKLSDTLFAL